MKENPPLYLTLAEVAAIWIAANVGYYVFLPPLGFDLSYNSAPYVMAAYFFAWLLIAIFTFRNLFYDSLYFEKKLWVYLAYCAAYGSLIFAALYLLSTLPIPEGRTLIPYSDILFATPTYFIPKATDILLQQTLIAALILALHHNLPSLRQVMLAYAVLFGGTHALVYALNDAPNPYAHVVTLAAFVSALIFPYLILRTRSGFVHTFIIHLSFYLLAALLLHAWPPPGYF